MDSFIPYGRQNISDLDIAAVEKVLRSPFITQGEKVAEFESILCQYTGAKHCVLVSNGTAALHIAVAAFNLPLGCEGITTPITFVASANAMLYRGIHVKFADIDPVSYCLSPKEAEKNISSLTKLMIPVHYAGRTADMPAFQKIAKLHDLRLIEDAAHAIGTRYPDGSIVGCCKYSDFTIFSFHPVKTITTGEGGAVTTNDDDLYQKLLFFRNHGITKEPDKMEKNPGPWYYEMHELGFNYRMTDFQAALGISQMSRLESFRARRLKIVKHYNAAFRSLNNMQIPSEENIDNICYHLYAAKFNFKKIGMSRACFMKNLREMNVGTQVHYIPVHLQPYYRDNFGVKNGDLPNSEAFYEQELSLPLYPALLDNQIEYVIETVKKCIKSA